MFCKTSSVIVIAVIIKTYELSVSYNPRVSALTDSERWPGFDADAPSGLLLPSAHPAVVQPLSAHRARPAAAVHGWIPLKPAPFNELDR